MRYVVSFTVLAAALPLIAFVYENWGFDALFRVLARIGRDHPGAVIMLPQRLPAAARRPPRGPDIVQGAGVSACSICLPR